jgi:hypothetical protein
VNDCKLHVDDCKSHIYCAGVYSSHHLNKLNSGFSHFSNKCIIIIAVDGCKSCGRFMCPHVIHVLVIPGMFYVL